MRPRRRRPSSCRSTRSSPGAAGRWTPPGARDETRADVSDVALDRAVREAEARGLTLATAALDLEEAPPPTGPWDVVVVLYFLHRPLLAALPALLAPGGVLVVGHATRRNLERHARPGPGHVLEEGELRGLVRGLDVLLYEEGWLEGGRHEARLVARLDPARSQVG